ncbi:major capsid protein [Acinetobacter corruptisaponis]|uniref:Major capsid protein n=1 Tax=Acinetobacter corruptisaponis TaxID=3045147 RepID=A0ABY8S5C0_9GAMM|nr:major capsid protein [Acinetobacter sp. KCTC 92772]WHP06890.1 major capsid protein [Acinetobacter sp. KCTC 92772]
MNLKNVEVMENTQKTKTSRFLPVATGVGVMVLASAARAEIDTAPIVSEISGLAAPIAAIGAAILLILVGIKGWKLIRRAM